MSSSPRPARAGGPDMEAARAAQRSWLLANAVMLAAIWTAVALISLFAPDLVSGSEQESLPVAALTSWLWGVVGTIAVLVAMGRLQGRIDNQPVWVGLTVAVIVIWAVATVVALAVPVYETGTDPTRLPLGAMLAPLGAAVLSVVAGIVAVAASREREWR